MDSNHRVYSSSVSALQAGAVDRLATRPYFVFGRAAR